MISLRYRTIVVKRLYHSVSEYLDEIVIYSSYFHVREHVVHS